MRKSINNQVTTMVKNEFPVISIQEYRKIKRKLIKDERVNFDHITAIPCSGNSNWYEIAEHSALFYYYNVCRKLQLPTKFHADTDSRYLKYSIGYIRSKGVDYFREKLKAAALYESEEMRNNVYVFRLKVEYSVKEMEKYKADEIKRRARMSSQLPSYNTDPALHQLIASSGARLHRVTKPNQDRPSIGPFAPVILELTRSLMQNYYRLTFIRNAGSLEYQRTLNAMRSDIYELLINIQMLYDFKLWSSDLAASVSNPLFKARNLIEDKIRRREKGDDKSETR